MDNNKVLQTENTSNFFVIVADRDGVRKYVSKSFPRVFQYTTQFKNAQRFYYEDQAYKFINGFNDYGKYVIENPEVRIVQRQLKLM